MESPTSSAPATNQYGKKLTAVLLCRNERKQIEKCLGSLVEQDFPKEDLELLVVDGMSEDGSREIIQEFSKKHPYIRMVDNPDKLTPFAFNAGIKNAQGDAILILNGHSFYPRDFFSQNINALFKYGVDNVGGEQVIVARVQTRVAQAIVASMSSSLGAGTPETKGVSKAREPEPAETVVYGCYRREVFQKIGYFDTRLLKGQDVEFNLRLLKNGGKILRIPGIYCSYMTRSNLTDFAKYYYTNGRWLLYPLKFHVRAFKLRHLVPFVMVGGYIVLALLGLLHPGFWILAAGLFAIYLLLISTLGIRAAMQHQRIDFFFLVPLITLILHFTAGFGSIVGLLQSFPRESMPSPQTRKT
jgi:GT2 family glycosyltransferase